MTDPYSATMSAALTLVLVPLAETWLQPAATVTAALVAIVGVGITVAVQRKSAKETLEQARRSADSAAVSAAGSDRSSKAAEAAVGVNRETAAGVARRAENDALAKRYQDAASQLGSPNAAVRLAGVHAMARLADDWQQEREACVSVLCAYMRIAPASMADGFDSGEAVVRSTIVSSMGAHLQATRCPNWCDCEINLTGAEIDNLNWQGITAQKGINLSHSRCGTIDFTDATFRSETLMSHAVIENLMLDGIKLDESARVVLYKARLADGLL